MDATLAFDLDGREYHLSAPTIYPLLATRHIISTYYGLVEHQRLGDIRRIVDIGACVGIRSLVYNLVWPQAEIVAIEPHPITFKHLVANCRDIKNIKPLCIAAGDKEERIRLALPSQSQCSRYPGRKRFINIGMCSRYGKSDDYVAEADAAPLDKIVDGPVDFIKIDVEGAEETVLTGAMGIINKWHPFMAIEVSDATLGMNGSYSQRLIARLARLGYFSIAESFGDPLFFHSERESCFL